MTEEETKTLSKKERKALEFKQKLDDKKKKKEDKKSEEKRDKIKDKKPRPKKQESETSHETEQEISSSTTVKRRHEDDDKSEKKQDQTSLQPKKKKRKGASSSTRFILFVGNLPFKYSVSELEEHLKPCSPDVIRPRDNKGFAFVEFAGDDASRRLNIALTKLHHTTFMGRKINVELTAGGGGNTVARKDKIREKNAKLDESRKADAEKEKAEKEQRKHVKFGEDGKEAPAAEPVSDGIHPSRRKLVKKN
ncbi:uncharacterized protein SAPINGB_P005753 [Magnusiomyces paraingens]|uniref:RRM domain-containing protein n=1 Tax=Magnusiomyces paraingens TaxID=2606893 RepID=A0A5E8C1R7_9ASCO|nr:uncharacterized protein SAPINGB_P005753 [Saprochaete ingens]VVT57553.1 unnamed protein product [Saprochaete ingens]